MHTQIHNLHHAMNHNSQVTLNHVMHMRIGAIDSFLVLAELILIHF